MTVGDSSPSSAAKSTGESGGLRVGVVANGFGLVVRFAAQVLLIRSMGMANFGLYALAISVILMVTAFGGFGVISALPRYLAIHHRDGQLWAIRQVLRRTLLAMMVPGILAAGVGLVLFLVAAPVENAEATSEFSAASRAIGLGLLFAPFMFLYTWAVTALSGLGRFRAFFWVDRVLMETLFAVATLGAWYATGSSIVVIAAFAARYVVVGIPVAWFVLRDWSHASDRGEDGAGLKEMIRFGLPVNLNTVGTRLARRVDIYVIAGVLGLEAVGLFRAATVLAEGVRKLATPIQAVAIVRLTKDLRPDGSLGDARQYLRSQWLNLLLGGLPLCVLAAVAPWLLVVLYGPEYEVVAGPLVIIAAGLMVMTGLGPIGSLFRVVGRNLVRMWIVLGVAVVNLGANLLLVPRMGIDGAAISTFGCMLLLCVIYSLMFRRFVAGYRFLSPPTVTSVVVSGALVTVSFLPIEPVLAASLMGAISLVTAGLILVGLGNVSKSRWRGSDRED